jgi:murein L,D-transpeptidase YafK
MIQFALLVGLLTTSPAHIRSDREAIAQMRVEPKIRRYAKAAGVQFPPRQILLRVFKDEKKMEVWGGNSVSSPLKRLVSYSILAASGGLGPKRRAGDFQVPEGWYSVSQFNPNSSYHLSLKLDYPNSADRFLATSKDPGNDIYIHGNHVSAGCLAMGDQAIEEIYTMARMSKSKVVVFILPSRRLVESSQEFADLWGQLAAINASFERNHRVPKVSIDWKGRYAIK